MMPRCAVGCDSVLFLCATSFTTDDAPWIGFQLEHSAHSSWIGVPAGTGVSTTSMPQLWWERSATKRSAPGPSSRSDQLQLTGRVSAGRGTNVKPRPEDWTEDGGLEHSAGSARAACGEQSQIRSGSIPSWATFGRANQSLWSNPGNRERAPKISMAGNLGKARQHSHYQPARLRK